MNRRTKQASQQAQSFRTQTRVAGGALLAVVALVAVLLLPSIVQPPVHAGDVESTPTPEPGLFRAYRALTTPVIDGNLADWPLLGGLVLNTDTAFSYNGAFSSYADGSTTCWSQWNDVTLFVACDTLDDVLIADSTNIWLDDTIELAFDGRNDNIRFCGTVFCPDDHLYELRVDGAVRDNDLPIHPGVIGAVVQRQGGYRLEIAIPWTEFDAGAFTSGKVMGFNLGLIDDDDGGGTEGHLFWRGYSTYSQPEGFGDIVLDPRSGTPAVTPSSYTHCHTHPHAHAHTVTHADSHSHTADRHRQRRAHRVRTNGRRRQPGCGEPRQHVWVCVLVAGDRTGEGLSAYSRRDNACRCVARRHERWISICSC